MNERLQVVDENDQPVSIAAREEAWANGLILRSVHIVLRDKGGNFLLQKRSMHKKENPGKFTWAASGHVDEGEDYETAALREMKEEIGIATSLRFVGKDRFTFEHDPTPLQYFIAVFTAEITHDTTLSLDPSEVSDTVWLSPNELRESVATNPGNFTLKMRTTYEKFFS